MSEKTDVSITSQKVNFKFQKGDVFTGTSNWVLYALDEEGNRIPKSAKTMLFEDGLEASLKTDKLKPGNYVVSFQIDKTAHDEHEICVGDDGRITAVQVLDLQLPETESVPAILNLPDTIAPSVRPDDITALPVKEPVTVQIVEGGKVDTQDEVLWGAIRRSTQAISFENYSAWIDQVLYNNPDVIPLQKRLSQDKNSVYGSLKPDPRFFGTEAYKVLKEATEIFLMAQVGIIAGNPNDKYYDRLNTIKVKAIDVQKTKSALVKVPGIKGNINVEKAKLVWLEAMTQESVLPYYKVIIDKLSLLPLKSLEEINMSGTYGLLRNQLTGPLAIDLIWNYWHEEAMLSQAMKVISFRFQNRRVSSGPDPLARFNTDPLRHVANYIWGYIQDEDTRLSVQRRAYEYAHQFGFTLIGKAIPNFQPADSRSKFVESFHNLFKLCNNFYKQADNTTILADGSPILHGLRNLHLLLTQGMHNQFGDLSWQARKEMLIEQWLLNRPQMREFLGGMPMLPYPQWMESVEVVKKTFNWIDIPVIEFNRLAIYGEQILLSIRYGNWMAASRDQSANWARAWRNEIIGYVHAYLAATGVDLLSEFDSTNSQSIIPGKLLKRRLEEQLQAPLQPV